MRRDASDIPEIIFQEARHAGNGRGQGLDAIVEARRIELERCEPARLTGANAKLDIARPFGLRRRERVRRRHREDFVDPLWKGEIFDIVGENFGPLASLEHDTGHRHEQIGIGNAIVLYPETRRSIGQRIAVGVAMAALAIIEGQRLDAERDEPAPALNFDPVARMQLQHAAERPIVGSSQKGRIIIGDEFELCRRLVAKSEDRLGFPMLAVDGAGAGRGLHDREIFVGDVAIDGAAAEHIATPERNAIDGEADLVEVEGARLDAVAEFIKAERTVGLDVEARQLFEHLQPGNARRRRPTLRRSRSRFGGGVALNATTRDDIAVTRTSKTLYHRAQRRFGNHPPLDPPRAERGESIIGVDDLDARGAREKPQRCRQRCDIELMERRGGTARAGRKGPKVRHDHKCADRARKLHADPLVIVRSSSQTNGSRNAAIFD